jgi:hypothetical protein
VVGVEDEAALVGALLADAEVVGDGAAVVGAADPLVVGAELDLAASGACLTASRVAKRVTVSTPLRIESSTSVVVILVRLLGRELPGDGGVRSVASFPVGAGGSGGRQQAPARDRPGG